MKNKIMVYSSLGLALIILITVISVLSNPLRRSQEQIEESILELTPIGMSMEDVLEAIESKKKWETINVSNEHGFLKQGSLKRDDTENTIIGGESIEVLAGKYIGEWHLDQNVLNTIVHALFKRSVYVYWGFDENSKLIGLHVMKYTLAF